MQRRASLQDMSVNTPPNNHISDYQRGKTVIKHFVVFCHSQDKILYLQYSLNFEWKIIQQDFFLNNFGPFLFV